MVTAIPASGTTIKMGSVYNAYYVVSPSGSPPAGTVVSLNNVLGSKIGKAASTVTQLSQNFGGQVGPNNYTPT